MLNPKEYQTPNAIDPGEAPPSRPSRRFSAETPQVEDVRANAARLLQASDDARTSSPTQTRTISFPFDADDRREDEENVFHGSLPSVEEARLYAGRILSAKSTRDLSPESAERARLTSAGGLKGVPLTTPPHVLEARRRRARQCLLALFVVSLCLIVVGLSVNISKAHDSSGYSNATPSTPPQQVDPDTVSQRMTETLEFLTEFRISSKEDLQDKLTPQYMAAEFMAENDVLQYPIPVSDENREEYTPFVQRYVLALLFYATNGPNWENQLLFLDKAHECSWGMRQDLSDGEVVVVGANCNAELEVSELLMPRNKLAGSLPSELAYLTRMTFFDVNRNDLTGSIPDELLRWTDIEFFDARYNSLTGTIPDWIGDEWPKLRALSLSDNEMAGGLPESMARLLLLHTLSLARNDFQDSLDPILGLRELMFVYLERNRFTGAIDDYFMLDMNHLVQVDVSSNIFSGSGIPEHFFSLPRMTVLDLSDNQITGTLPDFIPNSSLEFLALNDNILTGIIPESIVTLSTLRHLDLTGNDFTGEIPASLSGMTALSYLFLSENGFNKGTIPDFIQAMTNLREISLSSTLRSGSIPAWIGALQQLVLLDISYNDMTGNIPAVFWDMPQLSYLLLNRNRFSGDVPPGISRNSNLALLMLDKNGLSGDLSEACNGGGVQYLFADCDEMQNCTCCSCCADNERTCNDDILYTNLDFDWEHNYTRVGYAFSPKIIF